MCGSWFFSDDMLQSFFLHVNLLIKPQGDSDIVRLQNNCHLRLCVVEHPLHNAHIQPHMRFAMIHKHGVRITNVYAVCPPPRASCVDGGRKSHNTRGTNAMQMRPPPASNIYTQCGALSVFSLWVVNALPGDALSTLDLTWCGRHLTLDYNPPSAPLHTSPKTTTDPFSVPLLWLRICFLARPESTPAIHQV